MARAIWSGVLSFGLVSVPVELYTATENDKEFQRAEEAPAATNVVDLAGALQSSVEAARKGSARKGSARRAPQPGWKKTGTKKAPGRGSGREVGGLRIGQPSRPRTG